MTTMLNVITRLGLPGNSTLENRFLSVDIASTLFYWDHRAAQEAAQSGGEDAGLHCKSDVEQDRTHSMLALHPAAGTASHAAAESEQPNR